MNEQKLNKENNIHLIYMTALKEDTKYMDYINYGTTVGSTVVNSVGTVISNVSSLFNNDKNVPSIKQLSDNQILNIANDINGLFSETNMTEIKPDLSLPKLIVVGTQSSGKSSVLNGVMAMDILPTGKNMTTRTPLDIRLHQLRSNEIEGWVELGHYADNGWTIEKHIKLKMPIPEESQIEEVRNALIDKTNQVAGNGMNISNEPIILQIYSPNVPNLSLVDLPGLTMVACEDKGQPVDIKERIEQLVTSYIKQKRTIILAVMQARSDLETDLGLALIKKHENSNINRIIGVITKPDLMNYETHVGEYLLNNISKSLMLTYGYYLVKNRNGQEMKDVNIMRGYELEKEYLSKHKEYMKPIYKDRIGTTNLTNSLSKILITSITEVLPSVMSEILILENRVNIKLDKLGNDLPLSKEGKLSFLNRYVSNFYSRFYDSLESRGTVVNTGKCIKDTFIKYRTELQNVKPFMNTKIYDAQYFKNIISSFEGNHMSFHIPPIQILEACMTDQRYRPIMELREKSMICVDEISDLLIDLIRDICLDEEFARYPLLTKQITTLIIDQIINDSKKTSKEQIFEILKHESDYIWTDDELFLHVLSEVTRMETLDIKLTTGFLEGYYKSVKNSMCHTVPKIIMSCVIRNIEQILLSFLLQHIVQENKFPLLKEDDEIEKQRSYYVDLRNRINSIKKVFSDNVK